MDRSVGSPSGGRLYHGRLPARLLADQCSGIRVEPAHSSNQPCDPANSKRNNGLEEPQRPTGVGAWRRTSESALRFLGPRNLAPTRDTRLPSVIPSAARDLLLARTALDYNPLMAYEHQKAIQRELDARIPR